MGTTELENLIVRLTGDGSSYQAMMNTATATTQQVANQVAAGTQQVQNFTGNLTGFATNAVAALGLLGAATSAFKAFEKFDQYEATQIRLKTLIESSGRDAQAVTDDYKDFAAAISKTTDVTAGEVLKMLQKAEAYGLTGDAAKSAIKDSISIAALTGNEASSYISATAAMSEGRVQMVARQIGLRGIKNETELLQKVQERLDAGWKISNALQETTGFQLNKLQKSFAGLSKDVGALISDAIRPVIIAVREGVDWFNNLDPAIKKAVVTAAALTLGFKAISPVMQLLSPVINLLKGGFLTLFGPIGVAVAIAIVAIESFKDSTGGIVGLWEKVRIKLVEFWDETIKVVIEFIGQNKALVFGIGLTALTVLGVIGAFQLLMGVMGLLKLDVLLQTVAWVAYKAVVLAVSLVFSTAYIAAMLAAKAVTLIFNGVVGLVTGSMLILQGVLLIFAGGALFAGIAAIGAAVLAVYESLRLVVSSISDSGAMTGPISIITGLFGEWYDMLMDVVDLAKKDLPSAWILLKAYVQVAIEEVKALWPPLWDFIRDGFQKVWDAVSDTFSLTFKERLMNGLRGALTGGTRAGFGEFAGNMADYWTERFTGKLGNLADNVRNTVGDNLTGGLKESAEKATNAMAAGLDSPAVQEAKRKATELSASLRAPSLEQIFMFDAAKKGKQNIEALGHSLGNTQKQFQAFKNDAAEFGSVEMFQRLQDQADKFAYQLEQMSKTGKAPDKALPNFKIEGAEAGTAESTERFQTQTLELQRQQNDWLGKIFDKSPIQLDGADIEP